MKSTSASRPAQASRGSNNRAQSETKYVADDRGLRAVSVPAPVIGASEQLIDRLQNLQDRLRAIAGKQEENADRICGQVPSDSPSSGDSDVPSGAIHRAHYHVTVLEHIADRLEREVERLTPI